MSFEKDEYPMDEEAQKGDIISTKEHPASIMILAMDGDEIAGIGTIHSGNKIKARHQENLELLLLRSIKSSESEVRLSVS